MCYDKHYSEVIKEKIHIYEICPRCMRKIMACLFEHALCPICVSVIETNYPELFNQLKENVWII